LQHLGSPGIKVVMASPFKLSVLDQSPIPEGYGRGDALRNTLELASAADRWGFERYWLAEHHATPGLACNSPEVMIGPVAERTKLIRVGSGGIMLPHYSPLKVAENFGMLSSLFPGRIDLGIGRAAGTSPAVAHALQRDRRQASPDDFREQLDELLSYFDKSFGATLPVTGRTGLPFAETPETWLLGSSLQSAVWSAELGLPYVFADFINPEGSDIARYYRVHFQPGSFIPEPRVGVAVWAICAETDEEALRLSSSIRMMMTMMFRGRLIPVPTVERAEQFLKDEGFPLDLLPIGRRFVTGSPKTVRRALEEVAANYQAQEILVVNIVHDHQARLRSYELLAKAFDLAPRGEAAHLERAPVFSSLHS